MTQHTSWGECPRCGSEGLIRDVEAGEEACSDCGLVMSEEFMDPGPEWRAFTEAERATRARTGGPMSYAIYDRGLSTSFGGNRDARGNRLDLETRERMRKLRRYDNRSKMDESWGRNLSIAMAELDRLSTNLHIPQAVKEDAARIYRRALKNDLIRGRSIDAFVAAGLYAACRLHRIPRHLKSVSKASTREHSEIAHSYRLLLRELNLRMPVDDPLKFVPGIASKLGLRRDTELHAVGILRAAGERNGLTGKDPRGIAAAALYMACQEKGDRRIQKEVAKAAGTTEVTLRNRLKGLQTVLRDEPPLSQAQDAVAHAEMIGS